MRLKTTYAGCLETFGKLSRLGSNVHIDCGVLHTAGKHSLRVFAQDAHRKGKLELGRSPLTFNVVGPQPLRLLPTPHNCQPVFRNLV
jgi:hypothetical protein